MEGEVVVVAVRKMESRLEGEQRGLIWTELCVLNFSMTLGTPFLAKNRQVLCPVAWWEAGTATKGWYSCGCLVGRRKSLWGPTARKI